MAKHASAAPTVPRKLLLGALLAVLLLGLVTARAVGAIGGQGPSPTPVGVVDSGEPTSSPSAPAAETQPEQTLAGAEPRPSKAARTKAARTKAGRTKSAQDTPAVRERQRQRTDQAQKDLADAVEGLLAEPEIAPTAFRVASFNVLGHSHTVRGGNKRGFASGTTRMRMAVQILRNYGVDLVGFQELEPVQNASFLRMTSGRFTTYPGTKLGRKGVRNSLAWNTGVWQLVQAHTIPIPYFRGKRVPMPYVLLEHRETGQRVWAINIHNPTSNAKRGNNERWRDLGKRLQASLVRRLQSQTGYPVLLMGDFNERAEAFCALTAQAPLRASAGGSSPGRGCRPPADLGIDWIFGTLDIEFTRHVRTRAGLVARASDHPIVVADAVVTPDDAG